MNEQYILQQIRLEMSKRGVKLFRNQTGAFTDKDGRLVRFGLCVGGSDLIGWTPVTVTADMVGKRLAVFTAIEVKTPKGKTSPEQTNFIDRVKIDGGIAGVARSAEDATQITNQS